MFYEGLIVYIKNIFSLYNYRLIIRKSSLYIFTIYLLFADIVKLKFLIVYVCANNKQYLKVCVLMKSRVFLY